MLDVYGGGGKVAGGTYLVLLYMGMVVGKYYDNIIELLNYTIILKCMAALSTILTVYYWYFMSRKGAFLDNKVLLGSVFNPPGITFIVYSFLILLTTFFFVKMTEVCFVKQIFILSPFLFVGRHTLYIFLYHRLFLDFILIFIKFGDNVGVKWIASFGIMILGSVSLEFIVKRIIMYIHESYYDDRRDLNGKNHAEQA